MRRKLLAVAQRLGVNSIRATRLASAASDHAKDVTRNAALEVARGAQWIGSAEELCVDFDVDPSRNRSFFAPRL